MALQLQVSTPHGFDLNEAYANIDFLSFTARSKEIIFNIVFYKDQEAREAGMSAIPDMIVAGNAPASEFDLAGDLRAQVYEYVKKQAALAAATLKEDPALYYEKYEGTSDSYDPLMALLQYAIFDEASDV